MGINNYVVKGKAIKFEEVGTVNFYNYLNNKEHKNHKGKTEEILQIFDNKNFVDRVTSEVRKKNLETIKRGKGGRPIKSHSHSFMFSPQKGIKPSKTQWETITKRILKDLIEIVDITPEELKKYLFINVHQQENSHLNIVVGKVINGKSIHWSNKRVMKVLKMSFTLHFDEVMGTSHQDYKPKRQKERKTPQNLHQYNDLKEKLEQIEAAEAKTKKMIKNIGTYVVRIIKKQNIEKNREYLEKNLDKLPQKSKKEVLEVLEDYLTM